jgi:transposase-like protein
MEERTRRSFDKEFKRMVVELHKNGKSSNELEKELDIPSDMIRRWSREYNANGNQSFSGNGKQILSPEQKEIMGLKKGLERCPNRKGYSKKGLQHLLQERQQIFRFMKDYQKEFAIEKMCQVFTVSRSSYYEWLNRKPSKRSLEVLVLKEAIKKMNAETKFRLGSPKITVELRDQRLFVSRVRVARLIKLMGIRSIITKKFRVSTTDSNHSYVLSDYLLDRDFTAPAPAEKWVSDITYVRTKQGWFYLTVVMDLFDRKIIG